MAKHDPSFKKIIAQNRRAKFEYFIEEVLEAGIVLNGSEAKSIRVNGASINESHADTRGDAVYLLNSHIQEYDKASKFNQFEARKPRKLLLHKREINKLIGLVQKKGFTIVPLSLYYNNKNMVKVELAVVKGKKLHDKREAIKQEDWKRQKAQELKNG
jgi:SsrA-binding protein